MQNTWQSKAAAKRESIAARIPAEWKLPTEELQRLEGFEGSVLDIPAKYLDSKELEITEAYTAVTLAQAVQSGRLKAKDVASAFCKRAAIAHQLVNCLTEPFFEDAMTRGQWLDEYLAKNRRPVGPLHGVPISLKEPFNYVGVATSLGIVSLLDRPIAEKNSAVVDILLGLGAILYCKTNLPQASMSADSHNHVFGRTLNPHKLSLTAGGSTGGESALIALRGSILGVGTDIAGSIRIPALCCGIYGLKPTPCRVPNGGQTTINRLGGPGFPLATGPMATCMEDLIFFAKSVIDAEPWRNDFSSPAIPWRKTAAEEPHKSRRLRIGIYKEDPKLPLHPPIRRAIDSTAETLSKQGFDVIPITNAPSLQDAMHLAFDIFSSDNNKTFYKTITETGEPITPAIRGNWHVLDRRPSTGYNIDDLFDINMRRMALKAAWHKIWVDNDLDVILTPVHRGTAGPHDTYGDPPYTVLWNLLEFPVKWPGLVIPVGHADKTVDIEQEEYRDPLYPYDAEAVHGAPTAIQLVSMGYMDEELVAVGRRVDDALKATIR